MFVCRNTYDALIAYCPDWMCRNWLKLSRRWNACGCQVDGTREQLSDLTELIRAATTTETTR